MTDVTLALALKEGELDAPRKHASVITMVNNTKLEKTSLREMAATTVPALLMVESTVGKNTAERALTNIKDDVTPFYHSVAVKATHALTIGSMIVEYYFQSL